MSELDDAIREALSDEDEAFLARLGAEPSYPRMFTGVFTGPMGPANIVLAVMMVPILALAIWTTINFLNAASVPEMLRWLAGAALCVAGLLMIRFWYGMSIQFDRVIREVKRVELQVARLSSRGSE